MEIRRSTKIVRKVAYATGDIPHQFQVRRSKVEITRPLWWLLKSPLVDNGGILWRPHYRSHSLLNVD